MNAKRRQDEGGFAMPAMILLVLVLSLLGTASLLVSNDDRSAAASTLEGGRAFYAAESGLAATVETWNLEHYDTIVPRAGDSTTIAWTALENRCEYRVVVRNLGYKSRDFYSITSTGRGPGLRGGQRTVSLVVKAKPVFPGNAITADGDLEISGNPTITGMCSGTHVNGANFHLEGSITSDGSMSGTGDVTVSGNIKDSDGNPVTPQDYSDPQQVDDLDPMDYCGDADYFLRGGYLVDLAADDSTNIGWGSSGGWTYSGTKYSTSQSNPTASGTVCADDDIEIVNQVGSSSTPTPMTLISSKSISLTGNPYITGSHPDGILIMAGGDVLIAGNAGAGSTNYEGLIYADAQCTNSGTPNIQGTLVCRDEANPAGSEDWALETKINGNVDIVYNCGNFFGGDPVVPIEERPWSQVLN